MKGWGTVAAAKPWLQATVSEIFPDNEPIPAGATVRIGGVWYSVTRAADGKITVERL